MAAELHLDENDVVAFYAGRLSAQGVARVEAHVEACATCRAWLSAAAEGSPEAPRVLVGTSLAVGQRVAERYEIRRFVGAGGMGEVYEAFDVTLSAQVALKTLRSDLSADPAYRDRLRRELALARQVTHPHVSRVYDVGLHQGEQGDLPFFTLEFLHGETLAERMVREGKLPLELAEKFFGQIAAGLQAAHEAGVLHRDLKSHNVFLREGRGGSVEAVLTDFGLARSEHEARAGARSLTPQGTPAYMAPEQALGEKVTARADLYALGVVAFEMVTAELPPRAFTPAARAQKPSVLARAKSPQLPARWATLLDALLTESPEARPASAREALALLQPALASAPTRRLRRFAIPAAVLVMCALLVFCVGLWRWHAATGERRRVVVVLPFAQQPHSSEEPWLATSVTQMLSAELEGAPGLRVVSAQMLGEVAPELVEAAAKSGELPVRSLDALRRATDAELVVVGTVTTAPGEDVRVDARLYDAALGSTVAVVSEQGRTEQLFPLMARSGERLRSAAGRGNGAAAERGARALIPLGLPAARAYAEGSRALADAEYERARERFSEATRLEPSFAPAQAALARTYARLGMRELARVPAQRALAGAAELPDEPRREIEGLAAGDRLDWAKARAEYAALWAQYPDNEEHGLALADAQVEAGLYPAALETVKALHALPSPTREDPRIDLLESSAESGFPHHEKALAAADRAAGNAELRGQRSLVARARMASAESLVFLARYDEALALLASADRIFVATGDRVGQSRVRISEGHVLRDRNDLDGALLKYREAQAIDRGSGDEPNLGNSLSAEATIWRRRGKPDQALAVGKQALALFEKYSLQGSACVQLNNIGRALQDLGRPAEAKDYFRRTVRLSTEIGEQGMRARALGSLGLMAEDEGDLVSARHAFEDILVAVQTMNEPPLRASALDQLLGILVEQGDEPEARRRLREREQAGKALGDADQPRLDGSRAQVAMAAGRLGEARQLYTRAAELWASRHAGGDESEERGGLAAVLIAQGDAPSAQAQVAKLWELSRELPNSQPVRATAALLDARFQAELGNASLGLRELDFLLADKAQPLSVADAFSARLSRAHGEVRVGQSSAARDALLTLRDEAHAKGFGAAASAASAALARMGAPPHQGPMR